MNKICSKLLQQFSKLSKISKTFNFSDSLKYRSSFGLKFFRFFLRSFKTKLELFSFPSMYNLALFVKSKTICYLNYKARFSYLKKSAGISWKHPCIPQISHQNCENDSSFYKTLQHIISCVLQTEMNIFRHDVAVVNLN